MAFGKGRMLSSISVAEERGWDDRTGYGDLLVPLLVSPTGGGPTKCHHNVQCGKKAELDGAWSTLGDVPAHDRMGFKVLSNPNQPRIP